MSNEAINPLTNHAYDGIQEYDNPLPGWWKWTFVGSIVFSVLYALYFHIGAPGRSLLEQYDRELAINTRLQFKEIGDLVPNEATILEYMHKDDWLKVGQVVFKTNCVSCHGRDGEGKVGPNLTDDYYKNLRNLEGIAKVISVGAANGAMPAWGHRLHVNEVVLVSAYVASLRGNSPAEPGKAAEGNLIDPWPEFKAAASEDAAKNTATDVSSAEVTSAAPNSSE
ncbi:MAG: c-type cytochrome [Planctomycetales bacterium]|nr:c-type cytochrome [Planctomycetales bacterium]